MEALVTLRDEVTCNIAGLTPEHRKQLFTLWSIMVNNAHFMPAVQMGRWDGKINFVKKTGNTYINLLPEIIKWMEDRYYKITIDDKRPAYPSIPSPISDDVFSKYGITLRWYQVESTNAALHSSKGVLNLATGAGKSLINAAIINAYHPLKSMTIVPNVDLVTQTTDVFKAVGLDAGMFYAKSKEIDAQHIVSTWQSLKNHRNILDDKSVIILDEAHTISGQIVTEIMSEGNGATIPFRFGLTGTVPKGKADRTTLRAVIGETLYTLKAKQLQDEGFLSNIHIHINQLQNTPKVLQKKPKFERGDTDAQKAAWTREKGFLTSDKARIQNIADIIQYNTPDSTVENTLILIDSVKAGKALSKLLDCDFIYGATDTKDRIAQYKDFELVSGKILTASFGIASAGIDITKVHNVYLIDAGKAFTKIIQSIGRGLRKGGKKSFVNAYDISSNSYYSKKHMKERMKYYDEEQYPYSFEEK